MPAELLTLQTGFSGIQLVILVYVLVELRHSATAQIKQGLQIDKLNARIAHIMGRMHIKPDEEDA